MKLLIVYASTEGQTRKVARFIADLLVEKGHTVELLPATEAAGVEPLRFDRAILAASVHAGQYQKEIVGFARNEAAALGQLPSLFLSVSLTAAKPDPDPGTQAEMRDCVDRFLAETGWTPGEIVHVAGALRFSEYDWFRALAMRWIAGRVDPEAVPGEDREFTDWPALSERLETWLG